MCQQCPCDCASRFTLYHLRDNLMHRAVPNATQVKRVRELADAQQSKAELCKLLGIPACCIVETLPRSSLVLGISIPPENLSDLALRRGEDHLSIELDIELNHPSRAVIPFGMVAPQ